MSHCTSTFNFRPTRPHRYPITRLVTKGQETTQLSPLTICHNILRDCQLRKHRRLAANLHQQPGRHMPRDVTVERPYTRFRLEVNV